MTLKLDKDERIYEVIEVRTFGSNRKMFISKTDNNRITVLIYKFCEEDVKEDGTIYNKEMMFLIKEIDYDRFKFVTDTCYKVYPEFKILSEKNYSDKSLEDETELMNLENSIATDVAIRSIIEDITIGNKT
jgi:hypothetical protein